MARLLSSNHIFSRTQLCLRNNGAEVLLARRMLMNIVGQLLQVNFCFATKTLSAANEFMRPSLSCLSAPSYRDYRRHHHEIIRVVIYP